MHAELYFCCVAMYTENGGAELQVLEYEYRSKTQNKSLVLVAFGVALVILGAALTTTCHDMAACFCVTFAGLLAEVAGLQKFSSTP